MCSTRMRGIVQRRGNATFVQTEAGWVRFPASVRTRKQRVLYLLGRGLNWGAYLLAKHYATIVIAVLNRANPDAGWKNLHTAMKHT